MYDFLPDWLWEIHAGSQISTTLKKEKKMIYDEVSIPTSLTLISKNIHKLSPA
jgi:hypothetical protein